MSPTPQMADLVNKLSGITRFAGTAALLFITWNPRPGRALSNLCSPVSQQALFNGFLRGRE